MKKVLITLLIGVCSLVAYSQPVFAKSNTLAVGIKNSVGTFDWGTPQVTSDILIKPSHKGLLHKELGVKQGKKIPIDFYIGEPDATHHPLHFQADFLSKKGGMVPSDVMEAMSKVKELADKNKEIEELKVKSESKSSRSVAKKEA